MSTPTRREFLSNSAALIAGSSSYVNSRQVSKSGGLVTRTIGRTGISVPVVGMGCLNCRDHKLPGTAYDAGVRLFATARAYGNGSNEEMVGRFLKERKVRDKICLITKVLHPVGPGQGRTEENLSRNEVKAKYIEHVEGSLKRLGTDRIDILFYHSVDNRYRLNDEGVLAALELLKRQGKIRFTGVSTHGKVVREAAESGHFDVIMTQFNFTMADDSEYITELEYAAKSGVGIIAMKTQGGARYRNRRPVHHTAALKWALRHKFISAAVPGFASVQQLREDFNVALNLKFNNEEKDYLNDRSVRTGLNFCRMCGDCLQDCQKDTAIPDLMRVHMYAAGYGNLVQAGESMQVIPVSQGLNNCAGCDTCSAVCRHTVDIASNISDLKNLFGNFLPAE